MKELLENLKIQIIEQLNLDDITPSQIEDNTPLFGENGLGLDSIDALELIVLLDRFHGVKISNPEQGREIFHSVQTMAEYINSQKK